MNEKEILGLEEKRLAAMIERDFGKLESMVHDQLLYTHSSERALIDAEIGVAWQSTPLPA